MPESVKISELPVLSSVQPNDIVPVVDEFFTQTSKATAAQIAALGGGPPGTNTVSTASLQDNAVTAAKCAFTGPNKLFSRTATGPGSGVEIDCTPYARGLLASGDGAGARSYLGVGPFDDARMRFQTRFDAGTPSAPSICVEDDLQTGIFFGAPDAVSIAINGEETFRFGGDGAIFSRTPHPTPGQPAVFLSRVGVVAWCNFDATQNVSNAVTFSQNQSAITSRYGLVQSTNAYSILGVGKSGTNTLTGKTWVQHAQETRDRLRVLEASWGFVPTFPTEASGIATLPANPGSNGWFQDSKGKQNSQLSPSANWWPNFCRGTESRANYTFPNSGTRFWYYEPTLPGGFTAGPGNGGWQWTTSGGHGWIGTMSLLPASTVNASMTIRGGMNVGGVSRTTGQATGDFQVTFERALPDANYAVLATLNEPASFTAGSLTARITDQTASGFRIRTFNQTTQVNPSSLSFAVWR